jgi:hypothetical protein
MDTSAAELTLDGLGHTPDWLEARGTLTTPALGAKQIWFRVPARCAEAVVDSADPFVLASLQRTMAEASMYGVRQLRVHGTVSPSLIDNLEVLQQTWVRWNALPRDDSIQYWPVDIVADLEEERPCAGDASAIALFSGGVDSAFTVFRHVTRRAGRLSRDIDAAVLVHGFDIALDEAHLFRGAAHRCRRMLDSLDVDLVEVATNVRDLTLSWGNEHGLYAGAILSLVGGASQYGLLASTMTYDQMYLPWGSTPLTDPLMGTRHFQVVADGNDYDRLEKIAVLKDWPEGVSHLRFCWEGKDRTRNCGRCQKCVLTYLMLRIVGVEPRCFDAPITDDVVHSVIETMSIAGVGGQYPACLVLAGAEQRSLDDEWVSWLRDRLEAS